MMNKKTIQSEVEKLCNENISCKDLPMAYRTGLKNFKKGIVDLIMKRGNSNRNIDNHLYEKFIKSGGLKKQLTN